MIYTKEQIRLTVEGQLVPYVRMSCRKKDCVILVLGAAKSNELDELIESAGLDTMDYNARASRYRVKISKDDLIQRRDALKNLFVPVTKRYEEG